MIFNKRNSSRKQDYENDEQQKFELVSCPLNGINCTKIRSEMNRNYAESMDFRVNREFDKSINELQKAYSKTMELPETPCSVCAAFYRTTLSESMENIHDELKSMSTGLFRTSRYRSSYEKAQQVLAEFKENAKQKKQLKSAV